MCRVADPQSAGQVRDLLSGHPAGQPVEGEIADAAKRAGVILWCACTDHHVQVGPFETLPQALQMCGGVLAITVDHGQVLSFGGPCAAFDRGPVAHAVGIADHAD